MKRLYIIIAIFLINTSIFSQSIYVDNSLVFSQNNYGGTARFVGMGGAFGSLGGDLGSLSINPGGIGVFQSSELVFSPGLLFDKTTSSYLGNSFNDNKYKMNINNFGFVASYDLTNSDTRWTNFNFSVTYNKVNNFSRNIYFSGVSNYSLLEYAVDGANVDGAWDPLFHELLWQTYVLNEDVDTMIISDATDRLMEDVDGFRINQSKTIQTEGSKGIYNITFGANYSHQLYIGASIGIETLNYSQSSSHFESESAITPLDSLLSFNYLEKTEITGTGFTFKVGAIYKPIDFLRLGLAIHLPTFYELQDEFSVEVSSVFDNDDFSASNGGRNNYNLNTPMRFIGSLGLQISKFALFDIDYEYVDYSTMKLEEDDDLQDVQIDNTAIQNLYQAQHNIRVGAEFRTGPVYLRGGAAYSTSPFVKTDYSINHETSYLTFAGGIGYRVKNFFVDFAYSQLVNDYKLTLFEYNPNNTTINTKQNNFILSIGFKF